MTPADHDTSPRTVDRSRAALVVLCTASFIAVADTTIVSIALPSMRQTLGFSTSGLQWVLNAYALTSAGCCCSAGASGTSMAGGGCSSSA